MKLIFNVLGRFVSARALNWQEATVHSWTQFCEKTHLYVCIVFSRSRCCKAACKQAVFEQQRWSVQKFPWSGLSRLITLLLPRGSCHLLFLCSSFTWRVQVVLCSLHLPLSPKRLITQHSCLAHNHTVSSAHTLMSQHSNVVDHHQLLFFISITFKTWCSTILTPNWVNFKS